MTLSKKTNDILYNARHNDPEIEAALDEVSEILQGIIGVVETAAHVERPLDDTEEHKTINSALNSLMLAENALQAVWEVVYG